MVGVGVTLLGVYLLIAPIASATPNSSSVLSGRWTQVSVPRAVSLTGASVTVHLTWGYPSSCSGYTGYGKNCNAATPWYLTIFDCGGGACASASAYPTVGTTGSSSQGAADFLAIPGHYYELWGHAARPVANNSSIPVSTTIVQPVFGGSLGATVIGGGGITIALAVRLHDPLARRFTF